MHVSRSRVPKYEHVLPEIVELTSATNANITILFLRRVQTACEIKQGTGRLHAFSTVEQVEEILQGSGEYPKGRPSRLPAGGDRRVKIATQILSM